METETVAVFIPIVSMLVFGLVLWAFFFYRFKTRSRLQDTFQAAIAQGNELTPEMIEQISGPKPSPERDLRRGIIWLAAGLGFIVFGFFIGMEDADALYPMIGIGCFPILIGAGYLLMHRFTRAEG